MKTINEVIELMRDKNYGIGVTNEEEIEKVLNILVDNGFEENEFLNDTIAEALKKITTGDRQGFVIELFTDCAGRIVYVYTNKEDFDSNGERVVGEGILFSSIEFPDTKPIDLLRNFDIITVKDDEIEVEGIYYNGFLYTPFLTLDKLDDNLVEKLVGYSAFINKIVREHKTIWQREINIEDLELGTEVEVKVKGENDILHGVIISSGSEPLILFDNYTTTKDWDKRDYEIVRICE